MMRIVAGTFGGRRLQSPKSMSIRPTSDRVREAIFSMIEDQVPEACVLDLFAGTGALGLEALSRGAARVVFVDHSRQAVRLIQANAASCGVQDRVEVIHGTAEQAVRRLARDGRVFRLVFMDPPYGKGLIQKSLAIVDAVAEEGALLIAEHHGKECMPESVEGWLKIRTRKYGDTAVSIWLRGSSRYHSNGYGNAS